MKATRSWIKANLRTCCVPNLQPRRADNPLIAGDFHSIRPTDQPQAVKITTFKQPGINQRSILWRHVFQRIKSES